MIIRNTIKASLKILILLIGFLTATSTNAQHIEFMGIPLDGTIENFQSKLLNKGCSKMKDNSIGIRGYKGFFAGKEAHIFVYYNPKTQIVYQARAGINCGESKDNAKSVFFKYKRMLLEKYEKFSFMSDKTRIQEELECYIIVFQHTKSLGTIEAYIVDTDTYPSNHLVIINYSDSKNSSENENSELEDL